MPTEWWKTWKKVQKQQTRNHKEDGQAAAAEMARKMGCAYPKWDVHIQNTTIRTSSQKRPDLARKLTKKSPNHKQLRT